MANAGDSYTVTLKEVHLGWGTFRNTASRQPIEGESYLPIPRNVAMQLNIYNSNALGGNDILGENLFNCISADGWFSAVLKAEGSSRGQDPYAKQFSVAGNLKGLKRWYDHVDAMPGDEVRVTWTSRTDIVIERL